MPLPTCWGRRKAQQTVEDRWWNRISCDFEGVYTTGLRISRFLSETRRHILRRHLAPNQNSGKKGAISRYCPKVRLMSAIFALQKFEERSYEETLTQERCARKAACELFKQILQAQEFRQNFVQNSFWRKGNVGTYYFEEIRRSRFRGGFRSINAHDGQKRIELRRDGQ